MNAPAQGIEAKEPRSMRLNQGHREDIINSIRKAWVKNNDPVTLDHRDVLALFLTKTPKGRYKYKAASELFQRMKRRLEAEAAYPDVVFKQTSRAIAVKREDTNGYSSSLCDLVLKSDEPVPEDFKPFVTGNPTSAYATYLTVDGTDRSNTAVHQLNMPGGMPGLTELTLKGNDPFLKDLKALQREVSARKKALDQLLEETRDLLSQFNTTKQLRDGWPEIVPHLPPLLADPHRVVQLPALVTSRLNERLGL